MLKKIFPSSHKKTRNVGRAAKSSFQTSLFQGEERKSFRRRKKRILNTHISKISYTVGNVKKSSYIISGIGFVLFLLAFLIIGPFFKVNTIYISREDNIININSSYASVEYIRGKNIFFLDTSEIAKRLQKSQKGIQAIEFKVNFPSTLNITLKSYPALFQTKGHLILSNGAIIKQESNRVTETPVLHVSEDISQLALFSKLLKSQEIRNIYVLNKELKRNIPGFQIAHSKYYIQEKELHIQSNIGTIFIFDISNDLNSQIQKLAIYQKEQENIAEKKYIYIDVRIAQKLFLCGYDEEFSCRDNLKKIYGENVFSDFISEPS